MSVYGLSPVAEGILRAHIRDMIHESQGATTQTITPSSTPPGFRPFKMMAGVIIGSGMDAFQGAMGSFNVWANATCTPDLKWPMSDSTAVVESRSNFATAYPDAVVTDVAVRCLSVIAKCAILAKAFKTDDSIETVAVSGTRRFTVPASSQRIEESGTSASFAPGATGRSALGEILSAMSTFEASGAVPTRCNFSDFAGKFQLRELAVPRLKLIADAAFQGAISQLSAHSDVPDLPENVTVMSRPSAVTIPTVTYITNVMTLISNEAPRLIREIK